MLPGVATAQPAKTMHIPRSDNEAQRFSHALELWHRGDVAQAEAILHELVARRPASEDFSTLLAEVLRNQGRLDSASRVIFECCKAGGFDPDVSLRGAKFIQQCHRHGLADELCRATIARGAVSSEMWFVAGNIARELGDFDRARTDYLAALEAGVDLNSSMVFGALARTQRYRDPAHPDFAKFLAHFDNSGFSVRARAATGFGLAKAYDDIGEWRTAAGVLRKANALVRTVQSWDSSGWHQFVEARARARVARLRSTIAPDFVPVFILGLPRTGTTLTATRLASHIGARDRGELRVLRFVAEELIRGGHLDNVGAIGEAARLYCAHARQDDAPARYYMDQDPLNFRYLDLIEAMFPQAQIIHCRRDRGDTALSLWSQDFAHPDCAFAYDFDSIADYMAGHDELMAHWRRTLSLPIHTVDYELLVTEPQLVLRELAGSIGAPERTAPEAQVTPINSSSVWQARQPIYTSSVGRWRAYLPFVPELAKFATGTGG